MKKQQKLALMFISSFIGTLVLILSFVLFTLNANTIETAMERSDYGALVHQELLTSVAQTLNAYGLEGNVLDRVLTIDKVRLSIANNLQGLEALDLRSDVMGALYDEIERMEISFTQDVDKGMQELTDIVVRNYKQRIRLPLQGTITGFVERIKPWLFVSGLGLLVLFIVFINRLKQLSTREQNTVYSSIVLTWFTLLGLIVLVNLNTIVFEPQSIKHLILSIVTVIKVNALVLGLGILSMLSIRFLSVRNRLNK